MMAEYGRNGSSGVVFAVYRPHLSTNIFSARWSQARHSLRLALAAGRPEHGPTADQGLARRRGSYLSDRSRRKDGERRAVSSHENVFAVLMHLFYGEQHLAHSQIGPIIRVPKY